MKRSRFDALLDSAFGIRPGEGPRAFFMFLYLLAAVSAVIVGRTVRDALFLARYPIEKLPLMYVGVAFTVSIAAYVYSRVADRGRRDRIIKRSLLLSIAAYGASWAVLVNNLAGPWMYPTLYMIVEIISMLSIIQFWTFANDIFSSREAKRLFGFIGAGGVLSNILIGFAIGSAAQAWGAPNLLLFCVLLLVIAFGCVTRLARESEKELETALKRPRAPKFQLAAESERVLHSKHLQIIAGMVAMTVLTVTLVDYQFKRISFQHFGGDEKALASFFGFFYGFTGFLSCFLQFFLTGRILRTAGIVTALLLLPLSLLTGVGAMILVPIIPAITAVTIAKGAENGFRYTINDSTMHLLYVPVPSHQRARAKAFIDGILKPVCIGLSGLLIMFLSRIFSEESLALDLAYVDLVFLGAWLILVFGIRSEYVRSLLETLRSRQLSFEGQWALKTDDTTIIAIRKALTSEKEADIIHALELVRTLELDIQDALIPLLEHASETVRITALRLLSRSNQPPNLPALRKLLDDASDAVRAAAVRTYCTVGGSHAIRVASPYLTDPSAEVRASAVAGLIRYGGIDGILTAADALKALLSHEDPEVRVRGAQVLAMVGVQNFYQPIFDLIEDPALKVRLAAIEAAGKMRSPELVPKLIQKLGQRDTSRATARALVSYGEAVEDVLWPVLRNKSEPIEVRREIPFILAEVGGRNSFKEITKLLSTDDMRLRSNLARAAGKLRERVVSVDLKLDYLERAIHKEIQAAYQTLATIVDLEVETDTLLGEALYIRHRKHVGLTFRLLGIRYPLRTVQLIYSNLDSENKAIRANAIELADNILSSEEARLLLPLLEVQSIPDAVRKGEDLFELERKPRDEWLSVLLTDRDPWTICCVLHEIDQKRLVSHRSEIVQHLRASDPLVRETACVALSELLKASKMSNSEPELVELAKKTQSDEATSVRSAGQSLLMALGLEPA